MRGWDVATLFWLEETSTVLLKVILHAVAPVSCRITFCTTRTSATTNMLWNPSTFVF